MAPTSRRKRQIEDTGHASDSPRGRKYVKTEPVDPESELRASDRRDHPRSSRIGLDVGLRQALSRRTSFLPTISSASASARPRNSANVKAWTEGELGDIFEVDDPMSSILSWQQYQFVVNVGTNKECVLLVNYTQQPLGPRWGSHGVLLDTTQDPSRYHILLASSPSVAVFEGERGGVYKYIGHYKPYSSDLLSSDEWKQLPLDTRERWYDIALGEEEWMQVIRTYLDHADDTPVSWGEFNAAMSEEAAPQLRSWVLEFQTCRENFPGSRDVKPKRGIKKESKAAEYSLRAFRPVVAQRFRDVPPPPPVIGSVDPTLTFSRLHISSIFHGSPQEMIIRPGRNKIPYLENEDSMFYDFQWNSWAPRLIGEHGLVFFYARFPGSGPVAIPNPGNGLTLFSFVSRNNWRYMGQYRGRRFEPLSGAEWKHLPYKTKVEWFREAQNNKRWRDLVDDSDAVGAPGSNHSDPEFRKFEAAMGEEVVRIDCWLMEFIRYRHDYIDALTGRVPKGKKEEKKESADPEVKVEDVDFEVELHLPSDIIPDSPRRSTRQRLKGKGWALEG